MPVEDPGQLTVRCDDCDETVEMEATGYSGTPPTWGVDETTLQEHGWVVDGDQTFCPQCAPNHSEEDSEEE